MITYMCYICVCWYVPYVHNLGVHRRIYILDIKKEMVVLENSPWRSQDLLMMKKITADLKSKEYNTGSQAT